MVINSKLSVLAVNLILRFITFSGAGIKIGMGSWIKCKTSIGYGTGIGWGFSARGAGALKIGKYCAIGENVRIITSNHETDRLAISFILQSKVLDRQYIAPKKDVTIGHDVWIGDGAIILPGVSVGNGAVIGAGAVVTKSIIPYAIVAGNPAKIIKMRFDETIATRIESLAWWEWSLEEMKQRKQLFQQHPKHLPAIETMRPG